MLGRGRGRCRCHPNTEIAKPRQQVATLLCMMYYVMLQHAFDRLNSAYIKVLYVLHHVATCI